VGSAPAPTRPDTPGPDAGAAGVSPSWRASRPGHHIHPLFEAAPALADLLTAFWADPPHGGHPSARRRDSPGTSPGRQPDRQPSVTRGKPRSPGKSEGAHARIA